MRAKSDPQLTEALLLAGNDPKVTIRILQIWRGGVEVYQPKAFIEAGRLITPKLVVRRRRPRTKEELQMPDDNGRIVPCTRF